MSGRPAPKGARDRRTDPACATGAKESAWRGYARLLFAAAILHVTLSLSLQQIGRSQLLPNTFDGYGVAVAFVPDAVCYREGAIDLAGSLRAGKVRYWLGADYQFHEKLYSVCFALIGGLLGYGVLGAEPLNLLLYLSILVLVFRIGREVFDRRAGLLAAVTAALWPSLLLHTTQFIKDPLFIATTLALVLIVVCWASRAYSWAGALLCGAAGATLATVFWLGRAEMGALLIAIVLLGALTLAASLLRERRAYAPNLFAMAMLVVFTLGVPRVMPGALNLGGYRYPAKQKSRPRAAEGMLSKAAEHVGQLRYEFVTSYPYSGSNVDSDVSIDDAGDLLRYLPRAEEIGFFAPFPNMWLARGAAVGSAGRLLSGAESLAMYFVEVLAVVGLWSGRRKLAAWFLFAVAATAVTALGLVVNNVGALYRLRYPFLLLLITLAAGGAASVLELLSEGGRSHTKRGDTSAAAVAATRPDASSVSVAP